MSFIFVNSRVHFILFYSIPKKPSLYIEQTQIKILCFPHCYMCNVFKWFCVIFINSGFFLFQFTRQKQHKKMSYNCTICQRSSNSSISLMEHYRTYIQERNSSCSVCSKSFPSKSELYHHMKTHPGKNPFQF